MDMLFLCRHCGKHCCVGEAAVGKQFPCPDCKAPLRAPEPNLVWPCPSCGVMCSCLEELSGDALQD